MFSKKYQDINTLTMDLVNSVFAKEFNKHSNVVYKILSIDDKFSDIFGFLPEEECSLPGKDRFIESEYYKTMLKRYFFAGSFFCKNKNVLDSCSGLGWGAYTLSHYAHSVTSFDINVKAVEFCKKTWKSGNINWLCGNALDLSFLNGECFDVVTGMETIEHFTYSEANIYIEQMRNALCNRGVFIGTSAFPPDRKTADELCCTNPYHKYIFTFSEMNELLTTFFSEHIIIKNWMFIAVK